MDSGAMAGAGIVMVLLFLAGIVFLIVLFVAPIKLYSIHREIQRTNDLLTKIEERHGDEVRLLAALANATAVKEQITP